MSEPPLVVDEVTADYRGRRILGPLSLRIEAGCLTVIVGPNGAGKSTLMRLMTGELPPSAGRVRLDGRDIAAFSPPRIARRRAVLPQASSLAFPFTVEEVVRLGLEAGGRPRDPAALSEALRKVDLAGFSSRLYGELSGGEQQRVHLARVLCQIGEPVGQEGPSFLFLDEPVSSLDIRHQIGILTLARDFARRGGGAVAILHDLNLAASFADRMLVVASGGIAADGSPADVITDRTIESAFGLALRVGHAPAGLPFVLPQSHASVRPSGSGTVP